jgi:LEA14-like dessication related protein
MLVRLLSTACAVSVLAGCSPFEELAIHEVTRVETVRFDGKRLALRVDARVENPNGFRIQVEDPDVDLYINGRFIGKAALDSAVVLERKRTAVYPVYLHADLEGGPALMMLLTGALSGKVTVGAKGTVAGRARGLKRRFPFAVEHAVDLRGQ